MYSILHVRVLVSSPRKETSNLSHSTNERVRMKKIIQSPDVYDTISRFYIFELNVTLKSPKITKIYLILLYLESKSQSNSIHTYDTYCESSYIRFQRSANTHRSVNSIGAKDHTHLHVVELIVVCPVIRVAALLSVYLPMYLS